jgi:hypothetical protein
MGTSSLGTSSVPCSLPDEVSVSFATQSALLCYKFHIPMYRAHKPNTLLCFPQESTAEAGYQGYLFRQREPNSYLKARTNADHALVYSLPLLTSPPQEMTEAYFPSVLRSNDNLYLNGTKLPHHSQWKTLKSAAPKPVEEPKVDYSTYRAKTLSFADISPVKVVRIKEEHPVDAASTSALAALDD